MLAQPRLGDFDPGRPGLVGFYPIYAHVRVSQCGCDIYAHLIAGIGQRAVDGAAALIPRKVAHTVHTQEGLTADVG